MSNKIIDKDKLYAFEIIGELEDLYINKLGDNGSPEIRQRLEPLRNSINFIRDTYKLDDDSEYLYNQYVKGIRYSIIYTDVIEKINEESKLDDIA